MTREALMGSAAFQVEQLLPDGLYLHLPEVIYFAQDRIGSTDLSKLYLHKEGWWWSSELNPDRVDDETDARDFGKALHTIVLEGDEAFEERFAVAPDKEDYEGLCVTVDDLRKALAEREIAAPGGKTKDFYVDLLAERAPEVPVWDAILARFTETLKDEEGRITKTALSRADHRSLRVMAQAVREHPEIGALVSFSNEHIPLAEVSVLWTDEWGNRRRARLDLMIPTVTIDVKTLGNFAGKPLKFAAGERVAREAYHVQMADHHEARKVAYRFIREGKVHGGSELERAWIARFPDEAPKWDYVWLFYQKPDAKKGQAPVVFPWWEDFGDEVHRRGLRCAHEAVQTYRRCMAEFGPDRPWTRVEPVHLSIEGRTTPRVFIPHWIGGDEPLPNEEELLFA